MPKLTPPEPKTCQDCQKSFLASYSEHLYCPKCFNKPVNWKKLNPKPCFSCAELRGEVFKLETKLELVKGKLAGWIKRLK